MITNRMNRFQRRARINANLADRTAAQSHEQSVLNEDAQAERAKGGVPTNFYRNKRKQVLQEQATVIRERGITIVDNIGTCFGNIVANSLPMSEDFKAGIAPIVIDQSSKFISTLIENGTISIEKFSENPSPMVNMAFASALREADDPEDEQDTSEKLATDKIEDNVKDKVKKTVEVEKEIAKANKELEDEPEGEEGEEDGNDSEGGGGDNPDADDGADGDSGDDDGGTGDASSDGDSDDTGSDDDSGDADSDADSEDDNEDDDLESSDEELETDGDDGSGDDGEAEKDDNDEEKKKGSKDESSLAGIRAMSRPGSRKAIDEGLTLWRSMVQYNARAGGLSESGGLSQDVVAESMIQYTMLEALNTMNLIDLGHKGTRTLVRKMISESQK